MVDDRPCRTGLGSQPGFAPRNLPSRGRRIAEVSKATRTPMFRLCQLVPGNPRNRKCYVQVSLDGSRPSSLKLGGWGDIARSALGDAHVRRLHRLWMPRDRALRDRTTGGQRGDGALLVKLVDPHARLRADPAIAEYSGIHPVQLYCDDRRQQKRAGRHRGTTGTEAAPPRGSNEHLCFSLPTAAREASSLCSTARSGINAPTISPSMWLDCTCSVSLCCHQRQVGCGS